MKKILVYGYGNPGRQDDALGILLAEKIQEWASENNYSNISTDSNYQLNIEDAYELNKFDLVIFADASTEDIPDIDYSRLEPVVNPAFSMHSVSPEFIVGLCKEMYGQFPPSYLLHIKGYEWEFMEKLTVKAHKNLQIAFDFTINKVNLFINTQ